MAKGNNKKPNQINKVRRKAEEQDITLGSRSNLPEDDVKSVRKKGSQLEIKRARKPEQGEQETVKRGRKPKQEKAKQLKDRHRPRRSEIEKQFTHELQKIRNRLRYREKQGFWVKWESLPSRPSYVTQADIDRLNQYQVQLNDLGEIEVKRFEYPEQARKLRITKEQRPNYTIKNEEKFKPPTETAQQFNVLNTIQEKLEWSLDYLESHGIVLNHPINRQQEEEWIEESDERYTFLKGCYQYFIATANSDKRLEYADYLMEHEAVILNCIEIFVYDSNSKNVESATFTMTDYLYMH